MPLTGEEDILDTSQAAAEDDSRHPDASVKHVKVQIIPLKSPVCDGKI